MCCFASPAPAALKVSHSLSGLISPELAVLFRTASAHRIPWPSEPYPRSQPWYLSAPVTLLPLCHTTDHLRATDDHLLSPSCYRWRAQALGFRVLLRLSVRTTQRVLRQCGAAALLTFALFEGLVRWRWAVALPSCVFEN
jgi:hypothetical protein